MMFEMHQVDIDESHGHGQGQGQGHGLLGPEEDFSIIHNDASRSNDVKDRIDYRAMNLSKKWKKQESKANSKFDVDGHGDGDDMGPMYMKHMNKNDHDFDIEELKAEFGLSSEFGSSFKKRPSVNMNMNTMNANKNGNGGNSSSGSETGYTSTSSSTNSNSNSNWSEIEDDCLSFSDDTHTHEQSFDDGGLDNDENEHEHAYEYYDEYDDYSLDTLANIKAPTTTTTFAELADLGIFPSEIELIQAIILAEKASQSGQSDFKTTDQSKSALNEVKLNEIAARVVEATVVHRGRGADGGVSVGGSGKKGTMARRGNGKVE